jgi:hypothetical protein
MRKNEAGLTVLEIGDVVRIGSGRVHYRVTVPATDSTPFVTVRSLNTDKPKTVEIEKLILVKAAEDIARDEKPETDGPLVQGPQPNPAPVDTDDANEDEAPVVETSAYAKAVLFALNRLQKHVYAGTVRKNVKAKRRGLNARQKASRRANR